MPPIVSIVVFTLLVVLVVVVVLQWLRIKKLKLSDGREGRSGQGTQVLADAVNADVSSEALFATLSHELRTPLNGLLGIVQMLNEEKGDEDLEAIEGCARHMLAVISTLVNHSKIQAEWEDLPEYREWVNLYELMEQLKRNLAFRANVRGLDIELKHQGKVERVRGDADHLRNIIENAILGSLEAVSLVEIPKERRTLVVEWSTTNGEIKITIYNPLEEYSEERRRLTQTAGGLLTGERLSRIRMEYLYWSVSSMLLEKYSGALFARPSEQGGVTTLLSFEMEGMKASPSGKLPVGGLSLESQSSPLKSVKNLPFKLSILVAEDDPVARSLMATVLKHMGQESQFATNGREVLDLVSQSKTYDLILMDIDMPIMDGLSAAIALRNGEAGEFGTQVPIVAVTAFNTLSDESRFKKAGMNYFLPKPVRLKHLRQVLLEVVRAE